MVKVPVEVQRPQNWRPMGEVPVKPRDLRTRSTEVQRQKMDSLAQTENICALLLPFCSIQGLNRLDDVYPH